MRHMRISTPRIASPIALPASPDWPGLNWNVF